MKCADAEEKIYLYTELSKREQGEIDHHLATCLSCRRIMERVSTMRKTIALQRTNIPTMTNEAMMTRRVMDDIGRIQKKKKGTWSPFSQNPLIGLRYSMAALSVFLLAFFVVEYRDNGQVKVVKLPPRADDRQVDLNLASFHGAFFKARENKQETAGLISECVAKCLQSKAPDFQDCSEKFAKP